MGFLAKARKRSAGAQKRARSHMSTKYRDKRVKEPEVMEKTVFMGAPNKKKSAVRKFVDGIKSSRRADIVALQDKINTENQKLKNQLR